MPATPDEAPANPSPERAAIAALTRALTAQDLGPLLAESKRAVRDAVHRDPIDALVVTSLGGAWLFYVAERDDNPKVQSFWDALVFVTTCLSVGYANTFAVTSAGKAIASALMTLGPAMAARALEPPAAERDASEREAIESQRALTERIDALVHRIDSLVTRAEP